jgi:hypothetical protein
MVFGLGFVVGIQYSHALPELTPQASSADAEHPIATNKEEQSYWYKIGKPDILPVWLTMFVGAIVGFIALRTLGDIKKQTRIGMRTSLAAKRSAKAYIATERPFVIIETRGEHGYEFWAVNYGKSPAQIIFSNPVPFIDTFLLTETPKILTYGTGFDNPNAEQINVQWIAPGGSHPLGAFEPEITKSVDGEASKELTLSLRVMILYSAFKYRGIHSKQVYTSTYCYRKYPSGLRMWGAYGWNKYT